jgi:hypothetical protein
LRARDHNCRAFDSFAPAHSAFGLTVCVAGVTAAPLCETPVQNQLASGTDALQFGITAAPGALMAT